MLKFQNIPKLVVAYQSIKALYLLPFQQRRQIAKASKQYYTQNQLFNDKTKSQISKFMLENFDDKLCLIRWGEVSDRDFGGSSIAELFYSMAENCMTIKGAVDPEERQKLETIPFVGLIQKNAFSFKTGIFNSLRICLKGDGNSVKVEIKFFSPLYGDKVASATILTTKDEWGTYELPFRNFQIKGFEIKNRLDEHDQQNETVSQVIDLQMVSPDEFEVQAISFRLPDSERKERCVSFRSIQLVRTKKGTKELYQAYRKPYFYKVDPLREQDSKYEGQLDLGHFKLSLSKK